MKGWNLTNFSNCY